MKMKKSKPNRVHFSDINDEVIDGEQHHELSDDQSQDKAETNAGDDTSINNNRLSPKEEQEHEEKRSDVSSFDEDEDDYFDENMEIDFYKNSNIMIRPSQAQIDSARRSVLTMNIKNPTELLEIVKTLQHLLGAETNLKKNLLHEYQKLISQNREAEARIESYKAQLRDAEEEKAELFKQIDDTRDRSETVEIQALGLQQENTRLKKESAKLFTQQTNDEDESQILRIRNVELENELVQCKLRLERQITLVHDQNQQSDSRLRTAKKRQEETDAELDRLKGRVEALVMRNQELLEMTDAQAREFTIAEGALRESLAHQENIYENKLRDMKQVLATHQSNAGLSINSRPSLRKYINDLQTLGNGNEDGRSQLSSGDQIATLQALDIPENMGIMGGDFMGEMHDIDVSTRSHQSAINRAKQVSVTGKQPVFTDWDWESASLTEHANKCKMENDSDGQGSKRPSLNKRKSSQTQLLANANFSGSKRRHSGSFYADGIRESLLINNIYNQNADRIGDLLALQETKYNFESSDDEEGHNASNASNPLIKCLTELTKKNEENVELKTEIHNCNSTIDSLKKDIDILNDRLKELEEKNIEQQEAFKKEKSNLQETCDEITEAFIKQKLAFTDMASKHDNIILMSNRKIKNLQYEISVYKEQVTRHNSSVSTK